jgi:hypothetical protein
MATGTNQTEADLNAISSGEIRQVSCWLRGTAPELPNKFTQGNLLIGPEGMSWHHWMRHKDQIIRIPELERVQEVIRPAARSNGKKLKRGMFTNVVASGPTGTVEFVVPGTGPALIRQTIAHLAQPPNLEER